MPPDFAGDRPVVSWTKSGGSDLTTQMKSEFLCLILQITEQPQKSDRDRFKLNTTV